MGMGRPPPIIRAMPEKKTFFFQLRSSLISPTTFLINRLKTALVAKTRKLQFYETVLYKKLLLLKVFSWRIMSSNYSVIQISLKAIPMMTITKIMTLNPKIPSEM